MTEEIPDDWDPLTEEYCSVSFNTYNEGPGVNLPLEDLPAFSKKGVVKKLKTLSVKNVPVGLTEVGLKHLFNNCGTVLSVQKLQPRPEYPLRTIAYVCCTRCHHVFLFLFVCLPISPNRVADSWDLWHERQTLTGRHTT